MPHVIVSICLFLAVLVRAFTGTACSHSSFHSLQSGDVNNHQLNVSSDAFSVSQRHVVLWHLTAVLTSVLSVRLAMHSEGCYCKPPTHPHGGGETVCAPSAHQIPAGPLWSTGGEFREQPLVVPTQQPSFTEGLIKPDNIPSAWALLFSQLNAKWQLKASPRCRY